jgi:cob(I)alamin adenosyltransferase
MKIYTKKGDDGTTGLFGGGRVLKSSEQVAAYGEVDSLNSMIGLVRAEAPPQQIDSILQAIQRDLFAVGAELAKSLESDIALGIELIDDNDTARLERAIDTCEAALPPLAHFILPGGHRIASLLHVARTTCRSVERHLVAWSLGHSVRPELLRYFNRLSDALFVLARYANHLAGIQDVPWSGRDARG